MKMETKKACLFAVVLFFLNALGQSDGSGIDQKISEKLAKLEALFENFDKQITENGVDLLQLLNKVRNKAARVPTKVILPETENNLELINVAEENNNLDFNKRQLSTPIVFHAYLSQSYSVMSPRQTIVYNTEISNIGNAYDSNFGVFKAPFPGLYEFVATVSAYTGHYVDVEMVLNNRMLCRAHAGSYQMDIGMCVAIAQLNTGDDVFVRHLNGRGTYIYGGYNYPSFSGHLITRI